MNIVYGKWPFYRLGPFQEPFAILMSLGNFWANMSGLAEVRRRVRVENKLRRWLEVLAFVQMNTWLWSAVFHSRDTPTTERLDYFSATLTIAVTLLYSILRCCSLQTPLSSSRFVPPITAFIACLVLGHFTYLLSFPKGSFPYGYHTKFAVFLASVHNVMWVTWSSSFYVTLPTCSIGGFTLRWPQPYPPKDARQTPRPKDALTPLLLVVLTTLAMSSELMDFAPFLRLIDAHSLWHASTIPLTMAWWTFLANDAIELEGSLLGSKGMSTIVAADEKMPLTGGGGLGTGGQIGGQNSARESTSVDEKLGNASSVTGGLTTPRLGGGSGFASNPSTPSYAKFASMPGPPRGRSPGPGARGIRDD